MFQIESKDMLEKMAKALKDRNNLAADLINSNCLKGAVYNSDKCLASAIVFYNYPFTLKDTIVFNKAVKSG